MIIERNVNALDSRALDMLPSYVHVLIWDFLDQNALVAVLDVRILFWKKIIRIRDLFPLFGRIIRRP